MMIRLIEPCVSTWSGKNNVSALTDFHSDECDVFELFAAMRFCLV